MGWVVLGLIAAIAVYLIMTYNGLVAMRQRVNQAFADIDVQLKQRHDLIPNLVETVKGYATHEKSTLDAVIAARNAAQGAGSVHDKAAAEQQLSGAVGRLLALGEAYPSSSRSISAMSRTSSRRRAASSTMRSASSTPRSRPSRLYCSRRRWASPSANSSMSARPCANRSRSRRA